MSMSMNWMLISTRPPDPATTILVSHPVFQNFSPKKKLMTFTFPSILFAVMVTYVPPNAGLLLLFAPLLACDAHQATTTPQLPDFASWLDICMYYNAHTTHITHRQTRTITILGNSAHHLVEERGCTNYTMRNTISPRLIIIAMTLLRTHSSQG